MTGKTDPLTSSHDDLEKRLTSPTQNDYKFNREPGIKS